MNPNEACIIFLDNSVQKIFKTLEWLKQSYPNLQQFNTETELFGFLNNHPAEIIFLNLDLQPNDGIAVMKELLSQTKQIKPYIIIYSEKQDDFLQELAYRSGADAFIGFHLKPRIMQLYLQNLLWRRHIQFSKEVQKGFYIDAESYLVYHNGNSVQLPRREFQLLELLHSNSGKFLSKPEIAQQLWKDAAIAGKRIIDVHIYNLRQHFGRQVIQSQKGKGYRLNRKLIA